jgi:hypothetical protein
MSSSSDHYEPIKKIKFLGQFLLAFGGKEGRDAKLIFKDLSEKKHTTLKITPSLVFDAHETVEGKVKDYTPLGRERLDVEELKKLTEEDFVTPLLEIFEPVDLEDPALQKQDILLVKEADLSKLALKGEVRITEQELPMIMKSVTGVKALEKEEFKCGIFKVPGESGHYYILKIQGKYYKVKESVVMEKMSRLLGAVFVSDSPINASSQTN